jgi:hypothetical protein
MEITLQALDTAIRSMEHQLRDPLTHHVLRKELEDAIDHLDHMVANILTPTLR